MDPYSPPSALHDLPKQGQTYSPFTLNGNWFERRALSDDLVVYEQEQQVLRSDAAKRERIFRKSNLPYTDLGHRDNGALFVEDGIHLANVGMVPPTGKSKAVEHPALAIDMSQATQITGWAWAYASPRDNQLKGRNVFVIRSEDGGTYERETKRLKYGEPFYLASAVDWDGLEWRLTSNPDTIYDMDLNHRQQTVWLYPFQTANSLWKFQVTDREMHPIFEGEFVDARNPVMLMHVRTGKSMTINFSKRFKNAYGVEYLMTCNQDYFRGRLESDNAKFSLKIVTCAPWKTNEEKESDFRQKLETHIAEFKEDGIKRIPPTDRNMIGFNVEREDTKGPSADGWYNHQLNCVDEKARQEPERPQPAPYDPYNPPYKHSRFKQRNLLS